MHVRALMTSAALAAGLALAGCNTEDMALVTNAKANKPIPDKLLAEMQDKDMDPQSPILVRLFKQEAELEVWKQNRSGRFELLKVYPICRWSGDLGPKVKEGDRQAPEGFYTIGPAQMNPQSAYYLSFNTGYPNAFDKALGRTGSELMVHGDCSSRGCYAMTDEEISEIYALGREAFFGGQRGFQFQAYPFHLTAKNMARHRDNPNIAFWKMLKQGNDHFEVTHLEPKVDVCEKHYVFDAGQDPNSSKPPSFNPVGKCPAYHVEDDIAQAVQDKQTADETEFAELVAHNEPTAPLHRRIDGGMNAVYAAKLPDGQTGLSDAQAPNLASYSSNVGSLPPTVNPPHEEPVVVAAPPPPPPPVAPATRVAAADSSAKSEGFFSSLARRLGIGGSDTTATAPPPKSKAEARTASKGSATPPAPKPAETRPAAVVQTRPAQQPSQSANAAPVDSAVPGSQPIVSSNSFDSRFSALK